MSEKIGEMLYRIGTAVMPAFFVLWGLGLIATSVFAFWLYTEQGNSWYLIAGLTCGIFGILGLVMAKGYED